MFKRGSFLPQQVRRFPSTHLFTKRFTSSISIKQFADRLLKGDRSALSRAITLVESKLPRDHAEAQELLTQIQTSTSSVNHFSYRIGVSGPPGAGKSTFIEAFGKLLTSRGFKVAVIVCCFDNHCFN